MDAERFYRQIDVPRNVWDPTEVTRHSRYGERPFYMITGVEVHWVGPGTVADHGDTSSELLAFERFHEVSKGWYDLFYQVGIDSEGYTYEGRNATIPSQSDLKNWLTVLFVQGDKDPVPPLVMYQRLYDIWGTVNPARPPHTIRVHGDRATTACPGPDIKIGVDLMQAGWNPYEQEEIMDFNDLPHKPVPEGAKAELASTDKRISDGSNPDDLAARWESIIMSNRAYQQAKREAKNYTDAAIAKALTGVDADVDAIVAEVLKRLDGTELVITEQTKAIIDL